MLAIRMRRVGSKKRPFFRLVVARSEAARDGSFLEIARELLPASQAREDRSRSRARELLGVEGRAAVGHGAHADRAAPAAGRAVRGAGRGSAGAAARRCSRLARPTPEPDAARGGAAE